MLKLDVFKSAAVFDGLTLFKMCFRILRRLECKAICNFHFVPYHHSRCVKFILVLFEAAALEVKNLF